MKKAVIVIPTYNEAKSIELLIKQVFAQVKNNKNWDVEILVVDSTSPDGTSQKVRTLQKTYPKLHLLQTGKEGLGHAYIAGFKYAMERLKPYLLFEMDADLSHDPKKIPEFLERIEKGADFVIGSRYRRGGSIPADWAIHRKLFSVLGNLIIRLGFMKPRITDWTSGYRAVKVWIIQQTVDDMNKYTGYVFQVALIDNAIKKGAVIDEIPINFVDRLHGLSKINSTQYIAQTLTYVFRHSSFIRYGIVGLIGAIIDFGISYVIIEQMHIHKNLYWVATLISAEAAIISNFILNNSWSFAHKKIEAKHSIIFQFLKFNLIASGALAIQAIGIQVLTHSFGENYWYIYKFLILAFIVIPYSYILYNRIIWKDK